MTVVSDASPLIVLAKVDCFDLLRLLFGTIVISRQVFEEVVVKGASHPGAAETAEAGWIRVVEARQAAKFSAAAPRAGLGAGELSTIMLAKHVDADLVLLDDLGARRVAQAEGLRVQGSVGVLEAGFRRGHLKDLRHTYARLLEQGIYLDRSLLNASLASFRLTSL